MTETAPKNIFKDRKLIALTGGAFLLTAASFYTAAKIKPSIEEGVLYEKELTSKPNHFVEIAPGIFDNPYMANDKWEVKIAKCPSPEILIQPKSVIEEKCETNKATIDPREANELQIGQTLNLGTIPSVSRNSRLLLRP